MEKDRKRIIVIDDDSKFRILVRKILETKGFNVCEVADLPSAYKEIESDAPDLILLDLGLSDVEHGSDFLKERNFSSKLSSISTIVCSASNCPELVRSVIALGVDDYILKPIRQDWLLNKVDKCLKEKKVLNFYFNNSSEKVKARVDANLDMLGATEFKIESPVFFSAGERFKIDFLMLDKELGDKKTCRVNSHSKTYRPGVFESFCSHIGAQKEDVLKVKQVMKKWEDYDS